MSGPKRSLLHLRESLCKDARARHSAKPINIPPLQELAINTLEEYFDCLEEVGNVPPAYLAGLLARVSGAELYRFAQFNTGPDWNAVLNPLFERHVRRHKFLSYLAQNEKEDMLKRGRLGQEPWSHIYHALDRALVEREEQSAARLRAKHSMLQQRKQRMTVVDVERVSPTSKKKQQQQQQQQRGKSRLSSLHKHLSAHARALKVSPALRAHSSLPSPAKTLLSKYVTASKPQFRIKAVISTFSKPPHPHAGNTSTSDSSGRGNDNETSAFKGKRVRSVDDALSRIRAAKSKRTQAVAAAESQGETETIPMNETSKDQVCIETNNIHTTDVHANTASQVTETARVDKRNYWEQTDDDIFS